jgi:hypothetical protein
VRESGRLPEPLEGKLWSWVLWDSEPRIAVLARASSTLAVNQSFNFQLTIITSRLHLVGYDIAIKGLNMQIINIFIFSVLTEE